MGRRSTCRQITSTPFGRRCEEQRITFFPRPRGVPPEQGPKELRDEIWAVSMQLDEHFHATAKSTAPDPRHDGAFGLVLYALALVLDSGLGYTQNLIDGRLLLRSVLEAFITLRYLAHEDKPALWSQYRSYGSGQAKLTFLKNIQFDDAPHFIDIPLMEFLANEDMWMEFQDVDLGHWANLNLRKMAEAAGAKDTYDKFYDWASGYAHAQWACVRDTVYVNCLNPLHRFHRIPAPPRANMPSVLADACKLANRMLDDLNHLYPQFKPRIVWHKEVKPVPSASSSAGAGI